MRVNDWTTASTYADVIAVVQGAGAHLDAILLPKVHTAGEVIALDLLLNQLEQANGLERGAIGIEPQIEDALGMRNIDEIATASPRVQTLVFGPADFMASIGMRTLVVGEQPEGYDTGDAYHQILMTILLTARAHGLQAIDGPYLADPRPRRFPPRGRAHRRARLRRQVGIAPDPDRGRQRDLQPASGRLRQGRVDPGGLRVPHVRGGRVPRRGDARPRDDR